MRFICFADVYSQRHLTLTITRKRNSWQPFVKSNQYHGVPMCGYRLNCIGLETQDNDGNGLVTTSTFSLLSWCSAHLGNHLEIYCARGGKRGWSVSQTGILMPGQKSNTIEWITPKQFSPALRAARTEQPAVAEMPTHSFVQPATRLKPWASQQAPRWVNQIWGE